MEASATTDELRHRLESTFIIKSIDKQSDGSLKKDYDEELDEHSHNASGTIRVKEHSSIAALADGDYREHTILDARSGKELSKVSEVHHQHGLESDKDKEPSVTYTCKESKASNTKEKILEAFAIASLMLGNLKTNLGPKNQITLHGSDEEAVKFLFTALMVLGDKSTMKFGLAPLKTIKVE